ncbi:MAG: 50S ribosomal protein L7 [Chlamydiae bacterium SM23_39]|nr:MAG: 50S ribosomal protein L7 [Chlamydiae bacterium SM23_39]
MVNKKEEKIDKLVDSLSKLTVLELAELKKNLEEKWGVKAQMQAPVFAAPVAETVQKKEETEEFTTFNVTLEKVPSDKKIAVIKVVRSVTGLGLKEAKEIVEKAPKLVKENVPKVEAEEIEKKMKEAGGEVSLKGI